MNLSDTTIGIILGSSFTLLGVIVQGIISWFLNWRTHKMSVNEQREKENRAQALERLHKREAAYHGFVDIIGLHLMVANNVNKNGACILPKEMSEGIILQEMAKVLTSIQLNGSPRIMEKVNLYMRNFSNSQHERDLSAQDIEQLDMSLQDLAREMKENLAQAGCTGNTR